MCVPKAFVSRVHHILNELERILGQVDSQGVDQLATELMQADSIFLYGQGRTGFMTRAFANRLMHLGINAHFVGDTTVPAIGKGDLCLVNSGTGKTRFVYHVAAAAKESGARLATITAHPEARIGRMADVVVVIPAPTKGEAAGPIGSTQPPGSLFEQAALLLMDAVVIALMERLDLSAETLAARHANIE
jgi:6-phospho-3-hexuloisomerase